jgi:hypothetical protein
METWKDIKGYESKYQVSDLGRVKSLARFGSDGRKVKERILRAGKTKRGYYLVVLFKDGKGSSKSVHQLVAIAFLRHEPNGYKDLIVDHIDHNPLNNRLENLQLITNRLNLSKDKKGTSKYTGVSWNKGNKSWHSQIKINSKTIYLGGFKTELEASRAYQKALKQI